MYKIFCLACGIIAAGAIVSKLQAQYDLDNWQYVEPSTEVSFSVKRFEANPIIHREMNGIIGDIGKNINGPSLIRVPGWIDNPLGKYYLYFAQHKGIFIRMAYADQLEGPWKIYQGGVLSMEKTPAYNAEETDHVASPDVHVDYKRQQIRMYYHGAPRDRERQMSYVALSNDGLRFKSLPQVLGLFYFRVFKYDNWYYAFAKGVIYRSQNGLTDFQEGRLILPRMRHLALWRHNENLYVFFSRIGDSPEHILVTKIENLDEDWNNWQFTKPQTVLVPREDYEGVDETIEPSRPGAIYDFVHQLRDPAVYEEDDQVYLLYSTAGEWGIGIAEFFLEE